MRAPLLALVLLGCVAEPVRPGPAAPFHDHDGDGYAEDDGDCDDEDPAVSPVAPERCDGEDQDCDGAVDNDPVDAPPWFLDADGDGAGDPETETSACVAPSDRHVADGSDCDDADPEQHPGATWQVDADGDGFGDPADAVVACERPADRVRDDTDCDDTDPERNPDATFYPDGDGDGFGEPGSTGVACAPPEDGPGWADNDLDCDDEEALHHPEAEWRPDRDGDGYGDAAVAPVACAPPDDGGAWVAEGGDCDDTPESGADWTPQTRWWFDGDRDGFGDASSEQVQCAQPSPLWLRVTGESVADCDDLDNAHKPGVTWFPDADLDGYGVSAQASSCMPPPTSELAWVLLDGDCDDTPGSGAAVNPQTRWWQDADGDGYGASASEQLGCERPAAGWVIAASGAEPDCDDDPATGAAVNPGSRWYRDPDGDGYGDAGDPGVVQCLRPSASAVLVHGDCDEVSGRAAEINPASVWYPDADGDGYGDPAGASAPACEPPTPTAVLDGGDCDDDPETGALINPDTAWYADQDGDGHGAEGAPAAVQCEPPPGDFVVVSGDCDDRPDVGSPVHPGAEEQPLSARDEDCDGFELCAEDLDGDGWGTDTLVLSADLDCASAGVAAQPGDCDDDVGTGPAVHPGAFEVCDGIDNNCVDGEGDAPGSIPFYADADRDGYGDQDSTARFCIGSNPAGWVGGAGDCDDDVFEVNPGRVEVCNNLLDDDCNGRPNANCGFEDARDQQDADLVVSLPGTHILDRNLGFGTAFAVGDYNGDGVLDLAVGDVYDRVPGTPVGSVNPLTSLRLFFSAFQTDGAREPDQEWLGLAENLRIADTVATGDLNGDGVDDLLVSVFDGTRDAVYLWYGHAGIDIRGVPNAVVKVGPDFSRYTVIEAGDLDGDPADELVVGSTSSAGGAGQAYALMSPPSGTIDVECAGAACDEDSRGGVLTFRGASGDLIGGTPYSGDNIRSGPEVQIADFDGDGRNDVIIGAGNAWLSPGGGHVYVMLADAGEPRFSRFTSVTEADLTLTGVPNSSRRLGYALAASRPDPLTGRASLIIADRTAVEHLQPVWLVHGYAPEPGSVVSISDAQASVRYTAAGYVAMAFAGDVNGDGVGDQLVAQRQLDGGFGALSVRASPAFGPAWSPYAYGPDIGRSSQCRAEVTALVVTDVNEDGYDDALAGVLSSSCPPSGVLVFYGGGF